ncbi:MAG: beta-glucosidase [Firmicutes bacterium]|nr:beta-glucosidase [Bacillota bacterium]
MGKQWITEEHRAKARELLKQMTLEEKVAQLGSYGPDKLLENGRLSEKGKELLRHGIGQITRLAGASDMGPEEAARAANEIQDYLINHTRLGIPALFHEECLSGFMAKGGTTFPQNIGMAASFDPDLMEETTCITRAQMRAAGAHLGLSPVLDLARDLRWGRVEETFGEDPYLVASMADAYVKGLHGDDLETGVAATLKHYAGHGVCEGGRNHAPVHVSEFEMREQHMLPFEAVIKEQGVLSVMNAYHDWDGVPCACSRKLLTEILRDEWGFQGVVVADYWSIPMLNTDHKVSPNEQISGVMALKAGLDIELPETQCYGDRLVAAVKEGLIDEAVIDLSVERHLAVKFALGIFKNPMIPEVREAEQFETTEQRSLAREAARRTMVLLKNDGDILPLKKDIGSIAVIGPNAASTRNLLGDYAYSAHVNRAEDAVRIVSVLDGIKAAVNSGTKVNYAEGCTILGQDRSGIPEAVKAAEDSDVVVLVVGGRSGLSGVNTLSEDERYLSGEMEVDQLDSDGEFQDRTDLGFPGVQQELVEQVIAVGKPTIVVLINGRPLALPWLKKNATAILEAWLPGEEGGHAVADLLFGDYSPSGRLPVSIPKHVGQTPVHYNRKYISKNRNYLTMDSKPLYPFGYGLTYTTFDYTDLEAAFEGEELVVSCTVTNTGEREAHAVPQLYVSDLVAARVRPTMELKGFRSILLAPGESRRVTFSVPLELLSFLSVEGKWITEPGEFKVAIGRSSEDLPLETVLELGGDVRTYPKRTVFFSKCTIH